jgi:hypothetical protein
MQFPKIFFYFSSKYSYSGGFFFIPRWRKNRERKKKVYGQRNEGRTEGMEEKREERRKKEIKSIKLQQWEVACIYANG